jgi:hypothetical protein
MKARLLGDASEGSAYWAVDLNRPRSATLEYGPGTGTGTDIGCFVGQKVIAQLFIDDYSEGRAFLAITYT